MIMRIPNTIFDRGLIEICKIRRSEDGIKANEIDIADNVEIEILEPERPDYIFPHAEPVSAPTHIGLILEPLDTIQKQDILYRTGKDSPQFPRMLIINLYLESGCQILELEQQMR